MIDVYHLTELEEGVFNNLTQLQAIYISRAPQLKNVSPHLFNVELKSLKIIRIVHSGLVVLPAMHFLRTSAPLHMVDFDNNRITSIRTNEVKLKAEQLLLNYNSLEYIESHGFNASQIAKLAFKGNRNLHWLHKDCFKGLQSLRHIDLSETAIRRLPTVGLQELDELRLLDTPALKVFPSVFHFKYIREVSLTYPYHCCAFQFPATHHPQEYEKHQRFLREFSKNCTMGSRPLEDSQWGLGAHTSTDHLGMLQDGSVCIVNVCLMQRFLREFSKNCTMGSRPVEDSQWGLGAHTSTDHLGMFHDGVTVQPGRRMQALCGNLSKNYREVRCVPAPDAFNPCEDLMGNWALRVAVWLVAVAALLGNITVLLVLGSSRFRMTVPKFLMCHLAVADLCMGLYLLMIAAVDSRSIGDYFNYAIDWQNGLGCQVAGALTVFARQLSIYTLTVITIERWYTITYAMHLNKRLNLPCACKIMVCGWAYALLMAVCPLLGISGYSKTSICLPLENLKPWDLVYLVVLLAFNGVAFWVVVVCYGRMYCAIRGGQDSVAALTRSDMTVAKRMALLVFTDFACWAPIAFFGVTALAGYPLIDVSNTKILLVFFYPLNSCANPYLYALLTQQYRRDLFVLLSRYGLCSNTAAKYKDPLEMARAGGFQRVSVPGGSAPHLHRGSVLTTITCLDSTTPGGRLVHPSNPPIHKISIS
ncbi:thyrotropin receptor-like [Macrosteles quadrilineatus]|uniref:thyrotropin receptor-like n=1 Tax=Macrosteles quadrilineatus TaxID=74068 RepID=UPI0023E25C1A|nr:thyrotropin receptor-like [Macrosteles quadrilineatus]